MEGLMQGEVEIVGAHGEISAPADFTEPQVLYEKLMKTVKEYHPSTDLEMIEKA